MRLSCTGQSWFLLLTNSALILFLLGRGVKLRGAYRQTFVLSFAVYLVTSVRLAS